MRLRLLLVTSVALLLAADTAKDEAANKKDRDKLQGSWSLVRGEQDGRQVALDQVKFYRLSITGDKYTFKAKNDTIEGSFKIDAGKRPRSIDVTPEKGDTSPGVYAFEGSELKLCLGEPGADRPTEFSAKAGSEKRLYVFKRERP